MELSVVFVGTGGSVPTARRGLPAVLIRHGGQSVLVDCGEGTQRQLVKSVGLVNLDALFFTHFHSDHWLGFPGLIKTLDLRERNRPLKVYGPPGLKKVIEFTEQAAGRTKFAVEAIELGSADQVDMDGFTLAPFNVSHRGPAFGYVLFEPDRPGRLDVELARSLGITNGPDFGRLQSGQVVNGVDPTDVVGEPRSGRKVVISGDTTPCEALDIAAHQADLLIHEATFRDEDRVRAHERAHSTARQAAELAARSESKLLALTHISSRYGGHELLDEAREVFENTEVASDFDVVEIPFPERGAPRLIRHKRGGRSNQQTDGPEPTADQLAIIEPHS